LCERAERDEPQSVGGERNVPDRQRAGNPGDGEGRPAFERLQCAADGSVMRPNSECQRQVRPDGGWDRGEGRGDGHDKRWNREEGQAEREHIHDSGPVLQSAAWPDRDNEPEGNWRPGELLDSVPAASVQQDLRDSVIGRLERKPFSFTWRTTTRVVLLFIVRLSCGAGWTKPDEAA